MAQRRHLSPQIRRVEPTVDSHCGADGLDDTGCYAMRLIVIDVGNGLAISGFEWTWMCGSTLTRLKPMLRCRSDCL
jgi:hypothetical protein